MLQGLPVFNCAPGGGNPSQAAIFLNSENTLIPNAYVLNNQNFLWNVCNSPTGVLSLAPYVNAGEPNSAITMVYPNECDNSGAMACFGGNWQLVNNDVPWPIISMKVGGVSALISPITGLMTNYLNFTIVANGTYWFRGYSYQNPYYMDNWQSNNNFIRASIGNSTGNQNWFLDAPTMVVGTAAQVNVTLVQGNIPNGTATCIRAAAMLQVGQGIISPNNNYVFTLQTNGLYVYQVTGTPPDPSSPGFTGVALFCEVINCGANACFVGQNDGNAVVYANGINSNVLWSANGGGGSANYLAVQEDGNVVLYYNTTSGWNTITQQ